MALKEDQTVAKMTAAEHDLLLMIPTLSIDEGRYTALQLTEKLK